jgi:phytanoyl-CoA hydroxylase
MESQRTDEPAVLTRVQVDRYHADGFVDGGPVLSNEEVDELQREMVRVIDQRDRADIVQPVLLRNLSGSADAPVWQIVNIWMVSEAYRRLISNPAITAMAAQLTGASELRIWHDQIQYKPAAVGGVNMWHQDAPYWPILANFTGVTAWVALDDADIENGCMSMVRGSHAWGSQIDYLHTLPTFADMPAAHAGNDLEISVRPVSKGHVHFHHPYTRHGSTANTSGRARRAIAMHFMSQDVAFVDEGDHPMKRFVEVAIGEPVRGEAFPRVYPT